MSEQYVPPPFGTPCWVNILASDVQRAKKFYASVFQWKFRPDQATDDPNEIVHFEFGSHSTPGGITKLEGDYIKNKGQGGTVIFLIVDNLEDALERVLQAGGKRLSDISNDKDFGIKQTIEDTEGNAIGIYQMIQQ